MLVLIFFNDAMTFIHKKSHLHNSAREDGANVFNCILLNCNTVQIKKIFYHFSFWSVLAI